MADRKHTPDILGSLLGGSDPESPQKPVDHNTIKPEYHNTGMPAEHKDSKPVSQPNIKPAKKKKAAAQQGSVIKQEEAPGDKVKATFYISGQVVEDLEEGWIQLRKLTPKDLRSQVSKSLIVELAVQMALEELKSKSDKSLLARKVSQR